MFLALGKFVFTNFFLHLPTLGVGMHAYEWWDCFDILQGSTLNPVSTTKHTGWGFCRFKPLLCLTVEVEVFKNGKQNKIVRMLSSIMLSFYGIRGWFTEQKESATSCTRSSSWPQFAHVEQCHLVVMIEGGHKSSRQIVYKNPIIICKHTRLRDKTWTFFFFLYFLYLLLRHTHFAAISVWYHLASVPISFLLNLFFNVGVKSLDLSCTDCMSGFFFFSCSWNGPPLSAD